MSISARLKFRRNGEVEFDGDRVGRIRYHNLAWVWEPSEGNAPHRFEGRTLRDTKDFVASYYNALAVHP
jgi:hypothetical protein